MYNLLTAQTLPILLLNSSAVATFSHLQPRFHGASRKTKNFDRLI